MTLNLWRVFVSVHFACILALNFLVDCFAESRHAFQETIDIGRKHLEACTQYHAAYQSADGFIKRLCVEVAQCSCDNGNLSSVKVACEKLRASYWRFIFIVLFFSSLFPICMYLTGSCFFHLVCINFVHLNHVGTENIHLWVQWL